MSDAPKSIILSIEEEVPSNPVVEPSSVPLQRMETIKKGEVVKEQQKEQQKERKEEEAEEEEVEEEEEEGEEEEEDTELAKQLALLPEAAFGYRDVDLGLKEAFNYKESNHSTICDIIGMYLKGQKILYTEAKTLCEQRLNYLMLPTICITAICSVISVVLKEYGFSSTIVSSLNGLNFFFLTLINYLKLDAKAEAHRVSAYKFDKLQSKMEFSSGKILFVAAEARSLPTIITDIEKDVREIKETNQFILPESIRFTYPRLYNVNVFAEVKKIQTEETGLINSLKDVLNEHVRLSLKIHGNPNPSPADKGRLIVLEVQKKLLTTQIINIKNKYLQIDSLFEDEMEEQREYANSQFQICGCLKT
jgi:hypothetical protein